MAAPTGTGNFEITGVPNFNVGSMMTCTEAPTWSGGTEPYTYQYIWKYRPAESDSSDDWVRGSWTAIADPSAANIPPFPILAGDLEYQLGIKGFGAGGESNARYTSPTGPSIAPQPPPSSGQYSDRDVDNVPVDPQPGDVEITDAFGNVFDNFNQYGVVDSSIKDTPKNRLVAFYDKDNVLKNPQPAYQNLGYVQKTAENTNASPGFEPDAAQWIPRNVENQVRTPQKYVKSPLWPGGAPEWYNPIIGDGKQLLTIEVMLNVEDSEALVVTEDDVSTIKLELNPANYSSISNFG